MDFSLDDGDFVSNVSLELAEINEEEEEYLQMRRQIMQFQHLRNETERKNKVISDLRKKGDVLESQIYERNEQIAILRQRLNDYEKMEVDYRNDKLRITELEGKVIECANMRDELNNLYNRTNSQRDLNHKLKEKIKDLEFSVQNNQVIIENTVRAREDSDRKNNKSIEQLTTEKETLLGKLKNSNDALLKATKRIELLERDNKKFTVSLEHAQHLRESLESELSVRDKELSTSNDKEKQLESVIAVVKVQLQDLVRAHKEDMRVKDTSILELQRKLHEESKEIGRYKLLLRGVSEVLKKRNDVENIPHNSTGNPILLSDLCSDLLLHPHAPTGANAKSYEEEISVLICQIISENNTLADRGEDFKNQIAALSKEMKSMAGKAKKLEDRLASSLRMSKDVDKEIDSVLYKLRADNTKFSESILNMVLSEGLDGKKSKEKGKKSAETLGHIIQDLFHKSEEPDEIQVSDDSVVNENADVKMSKKLKSKLKILKTVYEKVAHCCDLLVQKHTEHSSIIAGLEEKIKICTDRHNDSQIHHAEDVRKLKQTYDLKLTELAEAHLIQLEQLNQSNEEAAAAVHAVTEEAQREVEFMSRKCKAYMEKGSLNLIEEVEMKHCRHSEAICGVLACVLQHVWRQQQRYLDVIKEKDFLKIIIHSMDNTNADIVMLTEWMQNGASLNHSKDDSTIISNKSWHKNFRWSPKKTRVSLRVIVIVVMATRRLWSIRKISKKTESITSWEDLLGEFIRYFQLEDADMLIRKSNSSGLSSSAAVLCGLLMLEREGSTSERVRRWKGELVNYYYPDYSTQLYHPNNSDKSMLRRLCTSRSSGQKKTKSETSVVVGKLQSVIEQWTERMELLEAENQDLKDTLRSYETDFHSQDKQLTIAKARLQKQKEALQSLKHLKGKEESAILKAITALNKSQTSESNLSFTSFAMDNSHASDFSAISFER